MSWVPVSTTFQSPRRPKSQSGGCECCTVPAKVSPTTVWLLYNIKRSDRESCASAHLHAVACLVGGTAAEKMIAQYRDDNAI